VPTMLSPLQQSVNRKSPHICELKSFVSSLSGSRRRAVGVWRQLWKWLLVERLTAMISVSIP